MLNLDHRRLMERCNCPSLIFPSFGGVAAVSSDFAKVLYIFAARPTHEPWQVARCEVGRAGCDVCELRQPRACHAHASRCGATAYSYGHRGHGHARGADSARGVHAHRSACVPGAILELVVSSNGSHARMPRVSCLGRLVVACWLDDILRLSLVSTHKRKLGAASTPLSAVPLPLPFLYPIGPHMVSYRALFSLCGCLTGFKICQLCIHSYLPSALMSRLSGKTQQSPREWTAHKGKIGSKTGPHIGPYLGPYIGPYFGPW